MLIKDILTIDLTEDIKNVIDLEDFSEQEIKYEIENYIVTDGLAKNYSDFVATYTSNIRETGVWISGFYGSGKSYFGKLLGYLLSNKKIVGTQARDRILNRFSGIKDEALIKNTILKLGSENSRVVFLDSAKQDTSKGFSYALFKNFLKSLELPENEHGFFLFILMKNDLYGNVNRYIADKLNENWADVRKSVIHYSKAVKTIYLQQGNSESEYENLMTTIRRDIDQFSPGRLRDELTGYFEIIKDEKVVFIFDEASEAVSQGKLKLLELEGLSEALTSLGSKVWTIAIAQERLDDVINNSNVSKALLTKVTSRFKTKVHLESTEVDVVIRSRLLAKKEGSENKLKEYYRQNAGMISDHAALSATGIHKTDTDESFSTYYPFYKYHFDLLQNFLFGTKGLASTKVAERGMISTTYDILKRQLQNKNVFEVATAWQITEEAQPQPPIRLIQRYDNAEKILRESNSPVSGRKLLETIHFLSEAEVVPPTVPNILKSFINNPEESHRIKEDVKNALQLLTEAKILLETNNTFHITSDLEQRLLDEMKNYLVQGYIKKKLVNNAYKASGFVKTLARISESGMQYDFYVTTDNEDELTNPSQKYLKVKIKTIYSISDDRAADIDALKVLHQNDKDLIYVVPDNSNFDEIDRLCNQIKQIDFLEEKYQDSNSEEARIIRSFDKETKERRLKDLVEQSLINGTAIYLFDLFILNADNWQTLLQSKQRQLVQNVYNKRLASQISDSVAARVIKETNNKRLQQYFQGDDFQFFDPSGVFIGDNLKVVEEVSFKIRNTFVDGVTLEKDLEVPPNGYTFGTVISTLAALMRGGKVIAKYNGVEKYSWRDADVDKIFANAKDFRKASFKAISESLTAFERQQLVDFLLNIEADKYTGIKVNYNTNDFELVNSIRELAKHFCDKVSTMRNGHNDFDTLFPDAEVHKDTLAAFTGSVNETNYIDKAKDFLQQKETYRQAIKAIQKIGDFIRTRLPVTREWNGFIYAVNDELSKAAVDNQLIKELSKEFTNLYNDDIVKHYKELQNTAQQIKDEYFRMFSNAAARSAEKYRQLQIEAENLLSEIKTLPQKENEQALAEAKSLLSYAKHRTSSEISIGFDVKDKQTRFTYSEVLSFIDLYDTKRTGLDVIRAGLIKESLVKPTPTSDGVKPQTKKYSATIPGGVIKVAEYKTWLKKELNKLASAKDSDEVEFKK